MPKRVIDFDAMWGSDKLASCAAWAQAEYAWLYGLADASGCFELTNLRVIWGRVAAIRRNLTIERLEQIFDEFQNKGLLFVWEHEGKRYGHWTGSDVPGRLPAPSWRMRLERLAPPVPKQRFAEYVSRYARGRATLPGGEFRAEAGRDSINDGFESSNVKSSSPKPESRPSLRQALQRAPQTFSQQSQPEQADAGESVALSSLKGGLEEDQAEDWNWDRNRNRKKGREGSPGGLTLNEEPGAPQTFSQQIHAAGCGEISQHGTDLRSSPFPDLDSNSKTMRTEQGVDSPRPDANLPARAAAVGVGGVGPRFQGRDKSYLVARDLAVGQGSVCGPVKVKAEALERIRARDAARNGSRSP